MVKYYNVMTSYGYDAGGNRTVNRDHRYTKHIYAGSRRIVSKVGDVSSFSSSANDPRGVPYVGRDEATGVDSIGTRARYAVQTARVGGLYAKFGVPYGGRDNNVYLDEMPEPAPERSSGGLPAGESGRFFHHPDHLGSSSRVTDRNGKVVQAVEYVPFGEVFLDLRNSDWSTPYLFNAKELDGETGLYYYGARYYDPRLCLWLSTDPLQEKYPDVGSYCYAFNNPISYIDPDGRIVIAIQRKSQSNLLNTLNLSERAFVSFNLKGELDTDLLNSCNSLSENFTALKALANSSIIYSFNVSDKNINGKEFYDKGSPGHLPSDYSYGITHLPLNESEPSPNENVYIITASFLSEEMQALNTAHEGYGHAYFYELKQFDKSINPNHTYGIVGHEEIYDQELNSTYPIPIFGKTNHALERQIKIVEEQAVKNYRNGKNN